MKEKIEDIIEEIKELQKYTGGGDIKISYDGNQTPQENSDTVTVTVTASIPTDQQGYIQKEYIWNERVVFFGESLRRGWGILELERNIRRNKYSFSAAKYVEAYAAATAYAKAELLKISRAQKRRASALAAAGTFSFPQDSVGDIIEDMSELQKYMVLLLSANDKESIKGKTRFQKELFLIAKNIKEVGEEASFDSDFYGPYSENAKEQLAELELDEVVVKDGSVVSLSKLGSQIAQRLEQKTPKQRLEMISEFKSLLNDLNDDEVLTFIYLTFPEFTEESLVLDEIKKNRKQVALKLYKKEKISAQRAAEIAGEPLESLGI